MTKSGENKGKPGLLKSADEHNSIRRDKKKAQRHTSTPRLDGQQDPSVNAMKRYDLKCWLKKQAVQGHAKLPAAPKARPIVKPEPIVVDVQSKEFKAHATKLLDGLVDEMRSPAPKAEARLKAILVSFMNQYVISGDSEEALKLALQGCPKGLVNQYFQERVHDTLEELSEQSQEALAA